MFELPSADNKRIAALTLHGLCPSDRAWVLAQLSPADRDTLQALIDELSSLGVPPDPELLKSAVQGARDIEPGIYPIPIPGAPQSIPSLSRVGEQLAQEPDAVFGVCLAAYDDSEAAVLLQSVTVERAALVRARQRPLPRHASALREAIRNIVIERARSAAEGDIRV